MFYLLPNIFIGRAPAPPTLFPRLWAASLYLSVSTSAGAVVESVMRGVDD